MSEFCRRFRPTPSEAFLANPHKGCCTFQHFNGDELFPGTSWSEEGPLEFPARKYPDVTPGYLPSTVAYNRWFWPVFEPEEGRYDFTVLDKSLETARARGQSLAIRLMAFGSEGEGQPQVPDWYARKYPVTLQRTPSRTLPIPVHDSKEYLEKFGGLIRECGRRYDGHPLIESICVGYIGPWGEGAGECSEAQCRNFNQVWREAFPTTWRLCEMAGGLQARVGIEAGTGWRWNCYGDVGDVGSPHVLKTLQWNHMYDVYADAVIRAGAQDTWKTKPVHFETGWVPMSWYQKGWDLDFILQQGLKYHMTYFMPKSAALPSPWMDKLAAFCRHIGYRYVYRQAKYDTPVRAGGAFQFHSWIENVGVAPIYRRYDFALRLRQGDTEEIRVLKEIDIRTWLPGDTIIDTKIQLPPSLKPGWVELAAGLLDPKTREPRVSFAAKENFSDRWLSLGGIEINKE